MATQTPTAVPDTPLYKLVAARLGRDPLDLIRERRAQDPPVPFARITQEILAVCNQRLTGTANEVYFTHEAPRRWLRWSNNNGRDDLTL